MSRNALLLGAPQEPFDITVVQYPCMPTTVTLHKVGDKGAAGALISTHTSSFNLPEGADTYVIKIAAKYLEDWTCKGLYYDGTLLVSGGELDIPQYKEINLEKAVKRGERHTIITDNGSKVNECKFYIDAPGAESISATEIPFYPNGRRCVAEHIYSITGNLLKPTFQYNFPEIVYPGNTVYSATEWVDLDTNRPIENCYPTRDYRLRAVSKESDDTLVGSYSISAEMDFSSIQMVGEHLCYTGRYKYSDARIAERVLTVGLSDTGSKPTISNTDNCVLYFVVALYNSNPYLECIGVSVGFPGSASIGLTPKNSRRVKIVARHDKLPL